MRKSSLRLHVANLFLALAYIIVTLQWLWVLAIGLPPAINSGVFDTLKPQTRIFEESTPVNSSESSPVILLFAGIATLIFLLLTVYILVKLPKTITKTGEKFVQQTTKVVLPLVSHHQEISSKKHRKLSLRITKMIQVILVLLPVLISFFLPTSDLITQQVIVTLTVWLAGSSLIAFIINWLMQPATTLQTRSRESRE
jgi:hypothetical protein